MPKPFDFGEVKLTSGEEPEAIAVPDPETPFLILLMGDFSGRESRGLSDAGTIAKRRAVLIDRDNFEEVMAKIAPEIHLPVGDGDPLRLRFAELDDFHPDRLLADVQMFQRLREIRARLDDPSTFPAAAKELELSSGDSRSSRQTTPPQNPSPVPVSRPSSGSLLDDMIEQTEARAPEERSRRAPDDVREFARRAAEPLVVATADPKQTEILAVIDRALSGQMRALLHNPDFQALEAAWRAVFLLVRRLETDSQLKIYLLDISKAELVADLNSSQDSRSTGLYRLLVEQTVGTPGAEPWAVVAGNFTFAPGRKDMELLAKLGKIAGAASAPFIAGASSLLVGCSSLASTPTPRDWGKNDDDAAAVWASLRRMNEAPFVGLAMPRFLLRLPYGSKTNPIDAFEFEEMTNPPAHEDYLWGNAAFACALLLGQSFTQSGWEMRPGSVSGIDDLPLHVYEQDGQSELKPCAEVLLTDEAIERIMNSGIMPLASYKGKDMARLVRFQSIADPVRALAGRWNG